FAPWRWRRRALRLGRARLVARLGRRRCPRVEPLPRRFRRPLGRAPFLLLAVAPLAPAPQLGLELLVAELVDAAFAARFVEQGVEVRLGEIDESLADTHQRTPQVRFGPCVDPRALPASLTFARWRSLT